MVILLVEMPIPSGGAEDEHVLANGLRIQVMQGDVRRLLQNHRVHRGTLLLVEQHLRRKRDRKLDLNKEARC